MDNIIGTFSKFVTESIPFEFLFTKTVGISLLIVLILVTRPLVRKYFNVQIAYRLWLILPIFLIIPVHLLDISVDSDMISFIPSVTSVLTDSILQLPTQKNHFEIILSVAWLVGSFITFSIYLIKYQKLKRSLIEFNYQIPKRLKPNHISVVKTKLVDVPAVFGLFRARLVLPEKFKKLSEKTQLLILRHEFYHVSRHDHQLNFIRVIFKIIFWFNPFIYIADRLVEADQEISCDSGVLNDTESTDKRNYAEALIQTAVGSHQSYLLSQWNYQSLIKERINMINNNNQKKMNGWIVGVFAISSIWVINSLVAKEKEGAVIEELNPIVVIVAKYPKKALKEGISGYVRFKMNVNKDASPFDIRIVDSEPEGVFDEAALEALKKWRFRPAMKNGKPVIQLDKMYTMKFVFEHEI